MEDSLVAEQAAARPHVGGVWGTVIKRART